MAFSFHKHCQAIESLLIFLHSLQPPLMMFKWKSKNTYNLFFLCDDCVSVSYMRTKDLNKCCSVFYSHQTRGSCNVILFRLVDVKFVRFQPNAQIQMSSQIDLFYPFVYLLFLPLKIPPPPKKNELTNDSV